MDSFPEIRWNVSELNKDINRLLMIVHTLEQIKDRFVTSCKCLEVENKKQIFELISKYEDLKKSRSSVKQETQDIQQIIGRQFCDDTYETIDGTLDTIDDNFDESDRNFDTNDDSNDYFDEDSDDRPVEAKTTKKRGRPKNVMFFLNCIF